MGSLTENNSLDRMAEIATPHTALVAATQDAATVVLKDYHRHHTLVIEVVATSGGAAHTPDAGTMVITHTSSGAALAGTLDLTDQAIVVTFDAQLDSITLTPSDLDADCSWKASYYGSPS